jgi:hypothetical protein
MKLVKKLYYYFFYFKLYKIDRLDKFHSKIIAEQIVNHIFRFKKFKKW